jgi:uncharacterized damage-inducible protein DinB
MDVTTHGESVGDTQAQRLERVYDDVARLLREPDVAVRLGAAPGENEWSAMQTLGHMTEMIPYWLHHCRTLIAAREGVPTFGRTPGSPERLAGVAHGASAEPAALIAQLRDEVRAAASMIRHLSADERAKRGMNPGRGELTVGEVIESFIVKHAEEHRAQVEAALRR